MNSPLERREVRLRGLRGLGLVVVMAVLCVAAPAGAQVDAGRAQKTADAAIARLRSPYCPGLMLEVCPSTQAELLRDSIRTMAAQGRSADAIVEDVLARHGEEWRAVPRRTGAGLWAWLIPPFALALGGIFLWGRLRAMRGEGRVYAAAPGEGVSDEERARLNAALAEFERAEDDE
ncbi:MAG TPA: cytochrome c-type biogenesis protein CcmH [Longimicrobium sp.]|nr:cytochrome c-type biogenesis protein CcmH [Longimicrobium sp.]